MIIPQSAIIAITLNCNSRCTMCNIWQNRIKNELSPDQYLKLPPTLTDINITGGEPFLRRDIVDIVRAMKQAAPRARLILNTNGFMTHKIVEDMKQIVRIDPKFAFRVSLDGVGVVHDTIRGIPGGYEKCMETLRAVKKLGVRDIGISFTLMQQNIDELPKIQQLCRDEGYEFSLTVVTSSPIYFGEKKEDFRPKRDAKLDSILQHAAKIHYQSYNPKEIIRGWFVSRLLSYIKTGKRVLPCYAGSGFFYMDSVGNVYTCHMKPWIMGNITKQPFSAILANQRFAPRVASCNDCFMVCTAKSSMRHHLFKVAREALQGAITAHI